MPTPTERTDVAVLLRTEHAVARVLASASDEDNAHPRLLAAIGAALGWDFGALWTPTDAEGSFLRCEHTWEGAFTPVAAFAETSRSVMLAPGQGLPGEVWQTGRPAWIADADQHPRPLPRAQAADAAGLRSAFAFPVRRAGKVLAVMEFFAAARVAPDDELLATMTSLGSQIGQFVRRCRAERGVRDSEARKTAILNAAFDCIITMDGDGRIVEVNAATETTFGYSSEQMVGQELAAIMIPADLREEHRRGLRNYMQTGASRIVGHPVDLTAMRADGSTFPVELAVMRPELPGPAIFCGYLRDVTERRQAELALQGMAEEQAALRRVATAVAAEVEPERLFGLIAEEVGRALDAGIGNILRYNGDGTALTVGVWSEEGTETIPVGTELPLDGDTIAPRIWRTHRPARYDSLDGMTGALAEQLRATGIKAAVGAPVIFGGNLWGAVIISSDSEPFPPEAEFRVGDFADLAAQAIANAQAREELAASRMRIVEASDAERRRLERNLHDGAQQRLVATSLALRLAARRVTEPSVRTMLDGAGDELALALEELRELARGLHPAVLTDHGLCAAIEAVAERAPLPVTVDVPLEGRLPETVEAAAYFVVCEALTNVAKYSRATAARVRVDHSDGTAQVEIVDDGVGGADARVGSGLRGLADRVEALGGRLVVSSPVGEGTAVRAQLPVS